MQLGMVGLGRMGANMTRRLMRGGHEMVVSDLSADAVKGIAGEGATGSSSLDDLVSKLKAPRAAWVMVPSGDATEKTVQALLSSMQAGDTIIAVLDNQLQREIDLAEIEVQERKAKLINAKRHQIEELERVRSFSTVEMKNVEQTKLELDALAAQLGLAEESEKRLKSLGDKGYATAPKIEEAARLVIALRKDYEVRKVELEARLELASRNAGKHMYSGNATIGSGDINSGKAGEADADVKLAEHEIEISHQKYVAFLKQRERQAVRSPFDGTILDLPRLDNGAVRRGDTIAIVEQRKERQVTAYLNQDEVMRVGLGDEAILFLPALGETMKGRVKRIDRTSGFIREQDNRQNPGYAWRGPTDRTAKVTIQFEDQTKVQDVERYRSGLPVVVVFEQRSTNSVISSIKKKLATAL